MDMGLTMISERKQAREAAEREAAAKKSAKRTAQETLVDRPAKTNKVNPAGVVPEEHLPPNKIIIIREFPDEYGKDELTTAFSRFPGFKEVRLVPGRKGIAFAEYLDETGATAARESMNGQAMGEKSIRVTFQRK